MIIFFLNNYGHLPTTYQNKLRSYYLPSQTAGSFLGRSLLPGHHLKQREHDCTCCVILPHVSICYQINKKERKKTNAFVGYNALLGWWWGCLLGRYNPWGCSCKWIYLLLASIFLVSCDRKWNRQKKKCLWILSSPLISISGWLYFLNRSSLQSMVPMNEGAWGSITQLASGCMKSIGFLGTGISFCWVSIWRIESWLTHWICNIFCSYEIKC